MSEKMPNWLKQRAYLTPERPAIITKHETLSFQELLIRVEQLADQLTTVGVRQGMHCALLIQNNIDSIVLIRALETIGAISVMLNIRLTEKELAWQMNDADVSYCFYTSDFQDKALTAGKEVQSIKLYSITQVKSLKTSSSSSRSMFKLDELHTIMYTSGTTGKPKGVMMTYGNHWWSAIGSSLNLGIAEKDRWLICVPLFHVSGLSILMRSLFYGITIVLHERFEADAVNTSIINEQVTMISVVSAMLTTMLKQLGEETYPENLRCVLLGGGPAPMPLLELCKHKRVPVFQTYGMTETASQIVTLSPEYMLSKLGSAGKPLFPAQLRIVQDGQDMERNNEGEIVVCGPNVTKGYYKRPDATEITIQQGWLHTGDMGYLDKDGFLYVLDRRSDLIISGGENIYPAEIESVLLEHPSVLEVGVCGVESERWGEVPAAVLVFEKNSFCSGIELKQFLEERLAKYKIPKVFYSVEKLPRNASMKLLRRTLKSWIKHEKLTLLH
ncbi:o-succinylbenzoate--CoA ligase [Bacillus solimangrovi]|uniref:2-succinylbenzoate--CoA ligase n=1 Tax=Bacillus solimangrovi TaxID=1305675 RepID=A0A1E5LGG6_9BACI|nr:o-succinylbenzoate--CoA ligase [Bacillus solimangrovi]OEH93146.1 o-succinylbenzoate--CoA ligase [Bacillus solimangrovi]